MRQTFEEIKQIGIGPYQDRNFCTVAALAMALDWSFGKAHRHMAKNGRKNKRGMYSAVWIPALEDAANKEGKTVTDITSNGYRGMTIGRFARERRRGVYVIKVRGHALCIRDGVMHDWTADTAGRRKIVQILKVEG